MSSTAYTHGASVMDSPIQPAAALIKRRKRKNQGVTIVHALVNLPQNQKRDQNMSVFVTNHSCVGLMRTPAHVVPSGSTVIGILPFL